MPLVYATLLRRGIDVTYRLVPGRKADLKVARGYLNLNGDRLDAGDGAKVSVGLLTISPHAN